MASDGAKGSRREWWRSFRGIVALAGAVSAFVLYFALIRAGFPEAIASLITAAYVLTVVTGTLWTLDAIERWLFHRHTHVE